MSSSGEHGGEEQEGGDDADGQVAHAGQLGQGGLLGVPGGDEGDEQQVDHHQVHAQGPDEAVLEGTDGEADDQNQAGQEEVGHHLLVAALQKKEANQNPEQAEEAENGAEIDAVVAADREQVHTHAGEELGEAAEEDGDVAQAAGELRVVSALDADTHLLQAEADDGGKQTKQADGFRVHR